MTVKDIINLLPKEHPLRLGINNMWEELVLKDDCAYNLLLAMGLSVSARARCQ